MWSNSENDLVWRALLSLENMVAALLSICAFALFIYLAHFQLELVDHVGHPKLATKIVSSLIDGAF